MVTGDRHLAEKLGPMITRVPVGKQNLTGQTAAMAQPWQNYTLTVLHGVNTFVENSASIMDFGRHGEIISAGCERGS